MSTSSCKLNVIYGKFVFQPFVNNYLAYTANNQSNAFVAEYVDFSSQSVTITNPYQINSAVEVVSLPLQTGYLQIDRKMVAVEYRIGSGFLYS